MSDDQQRIDAGESPDAAGTEVVARWAALPCDAARARRLQPLLEAQRQRMQRLYDEDVDGFEYAFLERDEAGR